MKNTGNPKRQIICSVCSRIKFTHLKDRDICRQCYYSEPTNLCSRCRLFKHQVSLLGLCPRCTEILERPQATCSRCSQTKPIYNQTDGLCHSCHSTIRYVQSCKAKQNKIKCSVCGCMKSSALLGEQICDACWRERQYGHQPCLQCGQLKVWFNKSHQLCKQCDKNRLARDTLRTYLTNFSTPYPYNKILFDLLANTINWECVLEKTNRRFHVFGRFLQTNQLPQPLTWSAIDNALPELEATNRNNPKQIRSCLFEIGHILAYKGTIDREKYVDRRFALMPIRHAPEHLQKLLYRYTDWLWSQKITPSNVRDHLEVLSMFWLWSAQRCINLPHEVQPSLINNYFLTLYWQWQCSSCQTFTTFDPNHRSLPKVCNCCDAVDSIIQVKRFAQNTVRQHRSKLKVFFDWALINKMVLINPVQRSIQAPNPTIHHYPLEIIKQLCSYIVSPDADPIEAIVLYLIIFHALSVWELRHTQIPAVIPMHQGIAPLKLSQADYLIVPKKEPSRGNHSPGRPSLKLNFPKNALPWLLPHLQRLEQLRQLQNPHACNQYLLVSNLSAHHNTPVGRCFPAQIVRSASLKVNGTVCNPNTLRKTAGVMIADMAGGGILRFLGWEDTQAFGYTWIPREVVYPQQPENSQQPITQSATQNIDFPSMSEPNLDWSNQPDNI